LSSTHTKTRSIKNVPSNQFYPEVKQLAIPAHTHTHTKTGFFSFFFFVSFRLFTFDFLFLYFSFFFTFCALSSTRTKDKNWEVGGKKKERGRKGKKFSFVRKKKE